MHGPYGELKAVSKRNAAGFTLVELLVTIAVAAILLSIALPSFQGSLRSNRIATTSNELLTSLNLARSEAVRSAQGGGICASSNGTACSAAWNDGWMVWTDNDGDGVFGDGDTVVRYSQHKPSVEVTGSSASISFDRRGRVNGGAAQSIGVVPEGVVTPVRCVRIGMTGQASIKKEACV